MNSSYVVETSYSVDGKLRVILIIVGLIILVAIVVSLLKLIKTGKIKIGKEKNNLKQEDNLIEETENVDNLDTLDDISTEKLNTDNLINDLNEEYEAPVFDSTLSTSVMQEQVIPQMDMAPNMQEQVMPQMDMAPNMQEQVMPQMDMAPNMQDQVMPPSENSSVTTDVNQLDNLVNKNEMSKSIWSNNSNNNLQ